MSCSIAKSGVLTGIHKKSVKVIRKIIRLYVSGLLDPSRIRVIDNVAFDAVYSAGESASPSLSPLRSAV